MGSADPGELHPALWRNPYSGFANTYQAAPSSYSAYNTLTFDAMGLLISGDAQSYSYLGARYYQQVPTGTPVTVVVTKDDGCDDHYVAFSTSPSPTAFDWSTASDRVLFAFDCDSKKIYGTSTTTDTSCSTLGGNAWTLTVTATTATWTDTNCGTISQGAHLLPSTRFQCAASRGRFLCAYLL